MMRAVVDLEMQRLLCTVLLISMSNCTMLTFMPGYDHGPSRVLDLEMIIDSRQRIYLLILDVLLILFFYDLSQIIYIYFTLILYSKRMLISNAGTHTIFIYLLLS